MSRFLQWARRVPAVLYYGTLFAIGIGFMSFLGSYAVPVAYAQTADGGVKLLVPPPVVPDAPLDFGQTIRAIIGAAQSGKWPMLIGLILTVLMWAVRRWGVVLDRVPDQYVPWVSVAIGVVAAIGAALAAGAPILDAVISGVNVGAVAIAGWETIGKVTLPKGS